MPDKKPAAIGDTEGIMAPNVSYATYIPAREWKQRELSGLRGGHLTFMVWGEISYSDSDSGGADYISQFCMALLDINSVDLAFVTSYNKFIQAPKRDGN